MANYFDIDDIIAEETQTSVTLRTAILGLGRLEPGNPRPDLADGTKMNMPLWLSKVLHREGYCTMDVPAQYGRQWVSLVGAGSTTIALGSCPYWYEVGIKVAETLPAQAENVSKMLTKAFVERYVEIFKYAQNFRNEDGAQVKRNYSLLELRLYQGAYIASTQFERWKNDPVTKLEASKLAELDAPLPAAAMSDMEREMKRQKGL